MQSAFLRFFFFAFVFAVTAFAAKGTMLGSGTAEDPWQIADYDDLKAIGKGPYLYDQNYVLIADIDASASYSELCNKDLCNGFVPIGFLKDSSGIHYFVGSMDGQNHTISNLRMWYPCERRIGFFSVLTGTLKNLNFDSLVVIGHEYESDYVGGVVGYSGETVARKSLIENVHVTKGHVRGHHYVGGIGGLHADGLYKNVSFQGIVEGHSHVGGVVGELFDSVESAVANAQVYATGKGVGGLAGYSEGGVVGSSSFGSVNLVDANYTYDVGSITSLNSSYKDYIGGLVGHNDDGRVSASYSAVNVYAYGDTYASRYVGGLIGYNESVVEESYATGNVFGGELVGGLIGRNEGQVQYGYALGNVTGNQMAGGIVGGNVSTIIGVYAVGNVHVIDSDAGPLVGYNNGTIDSAYWNKETSGFATSDFGTPLTTEQMRLSASFDGWFEIKKVWYETEACDAGDYEMDGVAQCVQKFERYVWEMDEGKQFPQLGAIRDNKKSVTLIALPTFNSEWTEEPIVSTSDDRGCSVFGRWINRVRVNASTDSLYYDYQIGCAVDQDTSWGTFSYMAVPRTIKISSYEELKKIGHHMAYPLSARYELTQDIDASATNFVPIGSRSQPFVGSFDGKGFAIKNMTIKGDGSEYVGFVARSNGAELKNIVFENATVEGKDGVGVVIGNAIRTTLENVISYNGTVHGIDYVGGLVGVYHMGYASKVASTGTVTGFERVGGLAGEINGMIIEYAYTASLVKGLESVGGIVGDKWEYGHVIQGYSASILKGRDEVSGITGDYVYPSVDDSLCYYDSTLFTESSTYKKGTTLLSTSQMLSQSSYESWDFENVWTIDEGNSYPYFKGARKILPGTVVDDGTKNVLDGLGTETEPYIITNYDELKLIGHYEYALDLCYKLERNITVWSSEGNFDPIQKFTGTFLGNNKKISGLKINQGETDNVGLFSALGAGAKVSALTLDSITVNGGKNVGGLVGFDEGAALDSIVVRGTIQGENFVGGIAGQKTGGSLSLSYSSGDVKGNDYIGGLFGSLENSSAKDCYSVAFAEGNSLVGGFAGTSSRVTVENAYAAGKITALSKYGEMVGEDDLSSWTSTYCDTAVWRTGVANAGESRNTYEMISRDNYEDWDFDKTWLIAEGSTYPYLKWNPVKVTVAPLDYALMHMEGKGTDEEPFLIKTYDDLRSIGYGKYTMSSVYRLANDIEFTSNDSVFVPIGVYKVPRAKGFGYQESQDTSEFTGKFLGAGFAIKNLVVDYSAYGRYINGQPSAYLIRAIGSSGIVDSLSLKDCSFKGTYGAAALASLNEGNISNVTVSATLSGGDTLGGLVAQNRGVISNCSLMVDITGTLYAGGIVGLDSLGQVYNSSVSGKINGGNYIGGAIGSSVLSKISNVSSSVNVTGYAYMGGAVGSAYGAVIRESFASGDLTCAGRSGGFVGRNASHIINSYATGNLSGSDCAGFVGENIIVNRSETENFSGMIDSCYATGIVKNYGAGFAIENKSIIRYSHATGNVTDGQGFVTRNMGAKALISYCYATGNVIDGNGFAELNTDGARIEYSYATGNVKNESYSLEDGSSFVSLNSGSIRMCYSTGDVSIKYYEDRYRRVVTGGVFVSTNNGVIENVYATGTLTYNGVDVPYVDRIDVSALVGEQGGSMKNAYSLGAVILKGDTVCSTVTNGSPSYNLYFNSGRCAMPDSVKQPVLSDSQMLHAKYFVGFDFDTVWAIEEGKSYPTLRGMENVANIQPLDPNDTTDVETKDDEGESAGKDDEELNPGDDEQNPSGGNEQKPNDDEKPVEQSIEIAASNLHNFRFNVSMDGKNAQVHFSVPQESQVSFALLDAQGRLIRQMNLGRKNSGSYVENLDLTFLRSGRYVGLMQMGSTRRTVLLNVR